MNAFEVTEIGGHDRYHDLNDVWNECWCRVGMEWPNEVEPKRVAWDGEEICVTPIDSDDVPVLVVGFLSRTRHVCQELVSGCP